MAYASIDDLLDQAKEFERRLENYYNSTCDRTQNPGIKMLSRYLGGNRRHVDHVINTISPAVRAGIRRTRLRYDMPLNASKGFFEETPPHREIGTRDFLEAAVVCNQDLIGFYRHIIAQPLGIDVRSMIECLIRLEENDIVRLKKIIAMNYF